MHVMLTNTNLPLFVSTYATLKYISLILCNYYNRCRTCN